MCKTDLFLFSIASSLCHTVTKIVNISFKPRGSIEVGMSLRKTFLYYFFVFIQVIEHSGIENSGTFLLRYNFISFEQIDKIILYFYTLKRND